MSVNSFPFFIQKNMFDFSNVNIPISKQQLFCHIDSETIFSHYFGNYRLHKIYSSPLRVDKKPSFGFIYNRAGELICNDIVTREKLGAVEFVARLFCISVKDAIIKIAQDFNISCTENLSKINAKRIIKSSNIGEEHRRKTKIQIVPKKFTKEELDYWNKWEITEEELRSEFAFSVEKLYINKQKVPIKGMCFAFYQKDPETEEGFFKILQPESKTHKWISNINLNLPFGIDRLPHTDNKLIIGKSYKERLILKKLFSDVIATQNESIGAIERCIPIANTYKETIVIFDADNPGVNSCREITNLYDWRYFNTPYYLFIEKGITDIAEFIEHYNYKTLEKLLKEKHIL